tara:strand:+ start:916 stop:1728 length:813 start_codon:yes stop_codon:yes gene_type:complete
MMSNKVVLLDMDGTITPPRQLIEKKMEEALLSLSKVAKVGIVTGSDFNYVMQQCKSLFNKNENYSNFFILPCNGTQKYIWDYKEWETGSWKKVFGLNMREHLGEEYYRKLSFALLEQMYIFHMTHPKKIPMSGHFISYRESLINWCPVGRSANLRDRMEFMDLDKEEGARKKYIEKFNRTWLAKKLCFSLGGSTSIDIYPCGWDKTQALNHFKDHDVWFIGDRCKIPEGNDKPLYDKIKKTHPERAYEVKNVEETHNIVENLINSFISEG